MLLSILKTIGGPGSIGFLAVCSAVGLVLSRWSPRTRRIGRAWLLSLCFAYVALGLPVVANLISGTLSSYRPLSDLTSLRGTDVIVVLDGDNRRERVRETWRLFEAISPRWVIVSGAEWLTDRLMEAGIPRDRLLADREGSTTLLQIRRLPRLLRERGDVRAVVIASRLQMPRVAALIGASGLSPALAPSSCDAEPPTSGMRIFIPTYTALRVSRDAIYEHFAIGYYRYQGLIP